jgi:hypothetical protein
MSSTLLCRYLGHSVNNYISFVRALVTEVSLDEKASVLFQRVFSYLLILDKKYNIIGRLRTILQGVAMSASMMANRYVTD